MKYEILLAIGTMYEAKEFLESRVIEMISQGWEPVGGVAITTDGDYYVRLMQAMIKR